MKKLDLTRILFLITSLVMVITGVIIPESNLTGLIIGALTVVSLLVLDTKASTIAKLSEDNPKVKTIRLINRVIIAIIIVTIFTTFLPIKSPFSAKTTEIILVGLTSILIMFLGNISPKIPFNRYVGLRLPWTKRDEETWKIAHKILGYLAFPTAIVMFILTFYLSAEKVAPACMLTWIVIPSLYSLFFYYKKIRGFNI